MPKEKYYFDHDYSARNDDKILELRSVYGPEGYGIFWMILETMAENADGCIKATLLGGLSLGYGTAKAKLLAIINHCVGIGLFYKDGDYLYSKRMLIHKDFRKSYSVRGKAGAEVRWKNSTAIAEPSHSHQVANAKESKGKESKGKESKEEERGDGSIIFDIEKYLLGNQIQFDVVCHNANRSKEEILPILKKYHLWNQEKENYPKPPVALIAGLQKWILNEKSFQNGTKSHQSASSGNTAKLGTSEARIEAAKKF